MCTDGFIVTLQDTFMFET